MTTPNQGLQASKDLVIDNSNGLHARPAALFVKTASRFQAEVWVEKDEERVNGKSIMGLMMLAAGKGSVLKVTAVGQDAGSVIAELDALIRTRFGEE